MQNHKDYKKYEESIKKERAKVKDLVDVVDFDISLKTSNEEHQQVLFPYGGNKENFLQWK